MLSLHIFHGVVDNPAYWFITQPGKFQIVPGPGDRGLGGVNMGDMGTGWGRCQGARTGIAKNIKYLYFCAVKLFKLIYDPQPIQGLFGKNPDMAESGRLNFEDKVAELNFPSILRELGGKLPFSACFFAFEIYSSFPDGASVNGYRSIK